MATLTGSYVCDNSSLANFKSWAMAISGAFASLGWVQTADTGQVNWSTISTVPSGSYVYEIWKAADAEAATLPIYLKVGYGLISTSPRIQMTAGTGSNGSGVITGGVVSSAPWSISNPNSNQGATLFPCFFSGDTGEFRMYMWQSATGNVATVFGVERSKDAYGAKTADYFTALSASTVSVLQAFQQTVLSSSLVGPRDAGIISPTLTSGSGTGAFNGTVVSLPVFPIFGKVGNPMLGFQTCCASDVVDGSSVTVASLYGLTHTFVAAVAGGISAAVGQRSQDATNMALLMRYE